MEPSPIVVKAYYFAAQQKALGKIAVPSSLSRGIARETRYRNQPSLDPAKPAIERRHRRREVGRLVARPCVRRSKINRRGQFYDDGAGDALAADSGRFEHQSHRPQQRAPGV